MTISLARIHSECFALLQSFAHDCKIPISLIPYLGTEVDITGSNPNCFKLETAQASVGRFFAELKESLGRTKKRELAIIVEKRRLVAKNIERYIEIKAQYDTRVAAAFASAFVSFRGTPDKVSPVVKGIMNGIKVCWHCLLVYAARYGLIVPSLTSCFVIDRRELGSSNSISKCTGFLHSVLRSPSYCATTG
jgi:hypothetical protein